MGEAATVPGHYGALPAGVAELVPPYLGRQRWYAGTTEPAADQVGVAAVAELYRAPEGHPRLLWALVDANGAHYQVLIGERPSGERSEFLNGHEEAVLGTAGDCYYYDATLDAELSLPLLGLVSRGSERADRVRPVGVEQSNTSLVFDDRVILKVFRRLHPGPNPDAEVTTALAEADFAHVAVPVARWRSEGWDLAFAQQFLAGGSEGWALALTSLRDFYASDTAEPSESGGDFAGEAARLGRMTAELHLAMAHAFGVDRRVLAERWWPALLASLAEQLPPAAASIGGGIESAVAPFLDRVRSVEDPGPAIRVHGDYHLGQVMRTDTGWYVLDFEGEPARPLEDRQRPASPLKDVAGMVRSFDYAARIVQSERGSEEAAAVGARAEAWGRHNREAFQGGFRTTKGIDTLVPTDEATWSTVLAAYEMEKALYEVRYEQAYRPDWVAIPLSAVAHLLGST